MSLITIRGGVDDASKFQHWMRLTEELGSPDMKGEFAAALDPGGLQTSPKVDPLITNQVIVHGIEYERERSDSGLSKQQVAYQDPRRVPQFL